MRKSKKNCQKWLGLESFESCLSFFIDFEICFNAKRFFNTFIFFLKKITLGKHFVFFH